jgi:glycosyltransferase involved in cell wall biosynthesis
VIAVGDEDCAYPDEVRFVIPKQDRVSYLEAARLVNEKWDAVCLQHEFGIFGGDDGEHVLLFLENLRVPFMVTCHTVLQKPSENQKRVLCRICELAQSVMVMSDRTSDILEGIYGVSCDKIEVIPHGVPDAEGVEPAEELTKYGGDPKLLTFGLLSPSKGIEVALDAVAKLKKSKPNVRYFVLGATHPALKRQSGEAYRESLVAKARDLGIEENVIFLDEYMDLPRLCTFLAGADVYLTPYHGKEQVVSGTLSYAVSFGLPVVSTPFVYAEELADKGAALLFPFGAPQRMAELVCRLIDDKKFRGRLSHSASMVGRTMRWPVIGRKLRTCFDDMVAVQARPVVILI